MKLRIKLVCGKCHYSLQENINNIQKEEKFKIMTEICPICGDFKIITIPHPIDNIKLIKNAQKIYKLKKEMLDELNL